MILSFDSNPFVYFMIGNFLIFVTGILSMFTIFKPNLTQQKTFIAFFILLNIFVIVMMRMPVILYNKELNPDESWLIAGAMTLSQKIFFWKFVDGDTSGPLNFYILVLFCELFSQPYDYISARIVSVFLITSSSILFFFTSLRIFKPYIAFICLFSIAAFLGTTRQYEFNHYSSEYVSVFLLCFVSFNYTTIYKSSKLNYFLVFIQGFVIALIIFAKLQAIPMAFCILLLTLWLIFKKNYQKSPKQFFIISSILLSGGVIFLGIFFIIAKQLLVYDNIIDFYFLNNLKYNNTSGFLFDFSFYFKSLFYEYNNLVRILTVLLFFWILIQLFTKQLFKLTKISFFVISVLFTSIIAVYKTGFLLPHYLLFLIFPLGLLMAMLIQSIETIISKLYFKVAIFLMLILIFANNVIYPTYNNYATIGNSLRPLPISNVSNVILKYTKSKESIAVWGGAGYFYLETKRIQGVPWNHTLWGLYSRPAQVFLFKNYVAELKKNEVPIFIDAYKPDGSIMDRKTSGYENVKELDELIKNKYTLLKEVDQNRIYIRNELYDARRAMNLNN
jgi:hypothetical protein